MKKLFNHLTPGFLALRPAMAGFGEGAGPGNPMIGRERRQNRKGSPRSFFHSNGHGIFENAPMDYGLVLVTIAILWLILFMPVVALIVAAATYIELFRRQNAALARSLSQEADGHRESQR
jgi:hypothetical protein